MFKATHTIFSVLFVNFSEQSERVVKAFMLLLFFCYEIK